MKWSWIRWLRAATVVVPCVWFIYVMFTVLSLDTSSTPPRTEDAQQNKQPLEALDDEVKDSLTQHHAEELKRQSANEPPDDVSEFASKEVVKLHHEEPPKLPNNGFETDSKETGSLRREELKGRTAEELAKNVHNLILKRNVSRTADNSTKLIEDPIDIVKQGVAHMDVLERGDGDEQKDSGGGDADVGEKRDNGSNDVLKGAADANLYADVTFPPYVETLPSGAEGQGPNGLSIAEASLAQAQQKEYRDKWDKNQFNQYVSDLIPVHRELPDCRPDRCRSIQYPSNLPKFSVVMVFYNEAWSTLLRSVHSILDRTSPELLLEIVLVDDFSSMGHLKKPLEKYFVHQPKVKIIRMPKRRGLIQARLRGFKVSSGEVVVFLDSHIECTIGWAEPLLWLVARDYRTVPFPVIDTISAKKLTYMINSFSPYGVFNLNTLTFTWSATLKRTPFPDTEARPSPTMPGGLFAISRKWFEELGTYDPELVFWGGENMELSFKTWMCGGSVVIADCSHVGHIFRSVNPVPWPQYLGYHNYVRVALVWMDRYVNHYLERINYRLGDYGDITERLAIRERLKCHDFGWYVDHVYPELKQQLVFNATYAGQVRNEGSSQCLDRISKTIPKGPWLLPCHQQGGNQFWYLAEDKYLLSENKYLCQTGADKVGLCFDGHPARDWSYNMGSQLLRHVTTGLCLQKATRERQEVDKSSDVMLAPCNASYPLQRWTLQRRKQFKYR